MKNALIAFNTIDVNNFLDNFRFDMTDPDNPIRLRTDFTPFQDHTAEPQTWDLYNSKHLWINMQAYGMWKDYTTGPNTTVVVSCYVNEHTELDYTDPQDPDPGTVLTIVHYLRDLYPGRSQILGVWNRDGTMAGQTLVPAEWDYTDPDNPILITPETVIGTPYYPRHPQYLNWMPDDVEYDANHQETSRTAATVGKEINKVAGWADRRW